ncbi:hypothetical protein AVEN_212819-1, partial [Araneus ventricosus]
RVSDISFTHRCLPQDDRKYLGRDHQEPSLLIGRSIGRKALWNVTLRSLKTVAADPAVNKFGSLAMIMV